MAVTESHPASFLLVHGSWHGAWCWDRLVPLLEERGHRVLAIDLPAHGQDTTSPFRATLGAYSECIQAAGAGLAEKPILVGHSMGGIAITQAASDAPDRFAGLVYLCAFVPLAGDSFIKLGVRDRESLVPVSVGLRISGPNIRRSRAQAVFYGDCSDEDAAGAIARLRPDPWRPLFHGLVERHPVNLPRGYVECTRDRAISISRQRAMAARGGIDRIATIETDHSPFLSRPRELASQLHDMTSIL